MLLKMRDAGTVIMIVLVTLAAVVTVLVGVLPAFSQDGDGAQVTAPEATVAEAITYQGQLTDANGNPLEGNHSMRFILYDDDVGGSAVFDSGEQTVNVADGLFNVSLPVPQSAFNGQALWLSIVVEGQFLSPRQPLTPAPYALSVRPGAVVAQDTAGDGLTVQNVATGAAVRAESSHAGLSAQGANFAVRGQNSGGANGTGYGGYFESTTGVGVFGSTAAVPSTTNPLPAGVYGLSENGAGVYGEAGGPFAWAGYFDGNVRVDGSLVISDSLFANDKAGYLFDIALNDGEEPLARGDVVVVKGVTDAVMGDIPVPLVHKAESEASTGVIGVVDKMYVEDEAGRRRMEERAAAAGEYVSIVTVGAFSAINVDATYGAIAPGDLLVSSPTPGHAMKAGATDSEGPHTGAIIGKALSALEDGTGAVAVMVSLQ